MRALTAPFAAFALAAAVSGCVPTGPHIQGLVAPPVVYHSPTVIYAVPTYIVPAYPRWGAGWNRGWQRPYWGWNRGNFGRRHW
jgi:hypothetical protein